jgi:hypothetical protein
MSQDILFQPGRSAEKSKQNADACHEKGATITTGILFTLESLGASFTLLGTWEAQNAVIQFLLVSDKN